MATYHSNVDSHVRPADEVAAELSLRAIGISNLWRALRRGWEDFKEMPSHALMLCAIYLVLARAVSSYSVLPLLFPLAAGFALINEREDALTRFKEIEAQSSLRIGPGSEQSPRRGGRATSQSSDFGPCFGSR
jgi:hypothetical protein